MSEKKSLGSYEVGYGKPPKNTQFQKGVSGNVRGRPKRAPDFDHELIRESQSYMTINENGRRKRISKHKVALKQLMKQVITGCPPAQRIYFGLHQRTLEKFALVEGPQPNNSRKYEDASDLTDAELTRIILDSRKKTERKSEK